MSATEIIAEIRKLPAAEQERVLAFLQHEYVGQKGSTSEVRYADDKEFDKATDNILRERTDLLRRLAQ
jgi:hypothetical protein